MAILLNGAKALESAAIGVGPAITNLKEGIKAGWFYTVESLFELGGGVSAYVYYAGQGLSRAGIVLQVFLDHLPDFISVIGHAMASSPLRFSLGSVGIFVNIARLGKESLSLIRQNRFLAIFKRNAWKGAGVRKALVETIDNFKKPEFHNPLPRKFRKSITGKEEELKALLVSADAGDKEAITKAERIFAHWTGRNIRAGLEEIKNLPTVELERALPEWLYGDIVSKGGKFYLNDLLKLVYKGDQKATAEATELLDKMQSYATKKRIVTVLKIIGAIIGTISCIGFFVAFPFGATLILLTLIGIFAGAAYMVNSGYVENREDRFSLILCIPEFVRNLPETVKEVGQKIITRPQAKRAKKLSYHPFFDQAQLTRQAMPRQAKKINELYEVERFERRKRMEEARRNHSSGFAA